MIRKKYKLGEICDLVVSGGTPSTKISSYYNGEIAWLKTKEVNFNRIYKTENTITEDGLNNSSAKLIPENSVIIAMYGNGDTAGRCAINKIPLSTNQACCNLIINKSMANYNYIFYLIQSRYDELVSMKNGGAQLNLNAQKIKDLEINIPSIEYQNKVAKILCSYDDLIENNIRRIKLLEESVELIYKEWFVNLRFPGYEKTNIVDGIPEGWNSIYIKDIAIIQGGYAFKSKEWQLSGNPVIKIKNINDNNIDILNCEYISDEVADKVKSYKLNEGDLLIAMTGATVGKIGIMQRTKKNYYLNQRVGRITSNYKYDISPYLFSIFNSNTTKQKILNLAKGSAQPNISAGEIGGISVLLPSDDILLNYVKLTNDMLKKRLVLIEQNEKLKEARDILIPRLIYGEIEV